MTNVVDRMPLEFRTLFTELLTRDNPDLLSALRDQEEPTPDQKESVDEIISNEIIRELGKDFEPSDRGKLAERTIEEFWYLWPSDDD